jgi:formylglycine-generating enzyme required for sulfatase activity
MQTTEVTQGQWEAVMGSNPSYFKNCGDECPVEQVSWNDIQEFIKKLNRKEGTDRYRLPTEAEGEYACRAGTTTAYSFGDDSGDLREYAWFGNNSERKTHPVGQLKPNDRGLYDMHGNVWEWCRDWYGDYPSGSVSDPTGHSSAASRVVRGGSWRYRARNCRSAYRSGSTPGVRYDDYGFRLVLSPGQQ